MVLQSINEEKVLLSKVMMHAQGSDLKIVADTLQEGEPKGFVNLSCANGRQTNF